MKGVIFLILWMLPLSLSGLAEPAADYLREGAQHMAQREYEEAVESLEKARDQNPNAPEIHNILGVAYLNIEDLEKAQASFEKAIQIKPGYAEAYFNLGVTYAQHRQDPLSAKEYFEKAFVLDPGYAPAYHALALVYLTGTNDPRRAAELFEKTIALEPDMAQAYFGLGMAYLMQGKGEQTLKPISELRRLNNETYAVALESLLRGDGVFMNKVAPSENAGAQAGSPVPPAATEGSGAPDKNV